MPSVFDHRVYSDQTHQAGEATYLTKAERELAKRADEQGDQAEEREVGRRTEREAKGGRETARNDVSAGND